MKIGKLAVCLLLIAATEVVTRADELQVDVSFPAVPFRYVAEDQPVRLATLPDVISRKTIVFIFASW